MNIGILVLNYPFTSFVGEAMLHVLYNIFCFIVLDHAVILLYRLLSII